MVRADRIRHRSIRFPWRVSGLTIGWVEGLEINFLGAVLGLDIRRPALKASGHRPIGDDGRDLEASSLIAEVDLRRVAPGRSAAITLGTNAPTSSGLDRASQIYFMVVFVDDPDKAIPRTKLWLENMKLARQRIRAIRRDGKIFKDHAALVVRFTVDQKVEVVKRHQ